MTRKSAIADCTAWRMQNVCIRPIGGRCLSAQILRERGHPLPKCRCRVNWSRYNLAVGNFRRWNFAADVWCFFVEIYENNAKLGYLNPILGNVGVTNDFGWWLVGKAIVDFLFASPELSSPSITVPELWGKMHRARLFLQRGRPLCNWNLGHRPPTGRMRILRFTRRALCSRH